MTLSLAIAAFGLGLFSSSHCLFMCGGISQALTSQNKSDPVIKTLLFHLGRISCYALLGLLLGAIIHQFAMVYHQLSFVLRHIAGLLLIAIGLYLAGFDRLLKSLENHFSFIWKALQPWVKPVIGMQKKRHALALGFLWGFLPCGIIYSTLLWAASTTQGVDTAWVMLLFGLGTLPSFLLLGVFSQSIVRFFQAKGLRIVIGGLFIAFGLWTILPLFPAFSPIQHPFC